MRTKSCWVANTLPRLRGREGWGRGLPVARRQARRRLRVLRRRYQGRGTAPVLLERRQFGERAHPYGLYTDSMEQLRGTAGARQVRVRAETALAAFTTPSSGGWISLGKSQS